MYNLLAGKLFDTIIAAAGTNTYIANFILPNANSVMHLDRRNFDELFDKFRTVQTVLTQINLRVAVPSARRLVEEFGSLQQQRTPDGGCEIDYGTALRIRNEITGLFNSLRGELEGRTFLSLTYQEAELFDAAEPPFGAEVAAKYDNALYDMNEGAKCLALERSTASAYHVIRCLEAALRALSRCLGIPDPTRGQDRSWPHALRAIKSEVDSRWPPNSA